MDNYTMNQNLDENKNLVHKMIKEILPSFELSVGILTYDDLFQEGMFGLWRAYNRFDPSKKVKFSTFACIQIQYAILDCLNKQQFFVKYPCDFKPAQKKEFEGNTLYLDQKVNDGSEEGSGNLIDILQSDSFSDSNNSDLEEALDIREAFSVLNDKERHAIEQKYFSDRTTSDIAKEEGVKRQSIDQRVYSGIKKLKSSRQLAFA